MLMACTMLQIVPFTKASLASASVNDWLREIYWGDKIRLYFVVSNLAHVYLQMSYDIYMYSQL